MFTSQLGGHNYIITTMKDNIKYLGKYNEVCQ